MREECRLPIGRPVTAITINGGRQVVRRFECSNDSSTWRVTLHALGRSTAEYALKVASLTLNLGMPAGEGKARDTVIDLNFRTGPSLGGRHLRGQEHQAADG